MRSEFRRGRHPRVIEWSQGVIRHRYDLQTDTITSRRAPQEPLQVVEWSERPSPERTINMGFFRVTITPEGVERVLNRDAVILPGGEIVRQGELARRRRRQRRDDFNRPPPRRRNTL